MDGDDGTRNGNIEGDTLVVVPQDLVLAHVPDLDLGPVLDRGRDVGTHTRSVIHEGAIEVVVMATTMILLATGVKRATGIK